MSITLSDIDPAKHGRYSPNFAAFLKKPRNRIYREHGYIATKLLNGRPILFFGFHDDGDFIGANLTTILCNGAKTVTYSFPDGKSYRKQEGVLEAYVKIGRCAFDPQHSEHYLHSEGRFVTTGSRRTCTWCGAVLTRVTTKRLVLDEHWIPTRRKASA
jgi:hypothetical protein